MVFLNIFVSIKSFSGKLEAFGKSDVSIRKHTSTCNLKAIDSTSVSAHSQKGLDWFTEI